MFKKILLFLGLVFVGLFVQTNVFGLSEAEGKNQSAKISVILPVYNVEKYLDESLKTVENQTYKKTCKKISKFKISPFRIICYKNHYKPKCKPCK